MMTDDVIDGLESDCIHLEPDILVSHGVHFVRPFASSRSQYCQWLVTHHEIFGESSKQYVAVAIHKKHDDQEHLRGSFGPIHHISIAFLSVCGLSFPTRTSEMMLPRYSTACKDVSGISRCEAMYRPMRDL